MRRTDLTNRFLARVIRVQLIPTPENDSNEILTQVIGLPCSGQTGRIHRADFDFWGLAEER
jgi:hypothetical protein